MLKLENGNWKFGLHASVRLIKVVQTISDNKP